MAALQIFPVTTDRWDDLERLFGPNGAYSNCWCTWWILPAKEWDGTAPADRRDILHGLVADGAEPGLLAYLDGVPAGWCAVGPRERYARLMSPRSKTFRPLDDRPSWVINCFFIARSARRRGLAAALLAAAVDYAFAHGAERIEAYPIDPAATKPTAANLFVGSLPAFQEAGFLEVGRVGNRPVVRLEHVRAAGR
ncbi:MAG: GNAT family N-acetyltransferase [Acidimicrobiia bacterium]|nr:GNAT family N-acetyltransferase [Acidimicrobiia bacterium]